MTSLRDKIYAIRIAVAITCAYFITVGVTITHPFWVLITVIFVSQPNLGATILRSKQRAVSTILGVMIGGTIALFVHNVFWFYALIGCVCLFCCVYFLLKRYDVFVFFITIIILLAAAYNATNVWHFVFERFIDTLIGIAIVYIFCVFIFPVSAFSLLRQDFIKAIPLLKQIMLLTLQQLQECDVSRQNKIAKLRMQYTVALNVAERHCTDLQSEAALLSAKRATTYAMLTQCQKMRANLYCINSMPLTQFLKDEKWQNLLNDMIVNADKIFTSMQCALEDNQYWSNCGLEHFASGKIIKELAPLNDVEYLYLSQRLESLISQLVYLYQAAQYFSEIGSKPTKDLLLQG